MSILGSKVKGTHTIYFSSSHYIINQKPMIPKTHFHCITTWVARSSGRNSPMHLLILWFRLTSQMALLFNINFYFGCKTRLCLTVPGRHEKIYFCKKSFYLQGIFDDINEQDTSFLDCKYKHMMKSRAPPGKFGVLYLMVTYRIPWFYK